MDFTLMYCRVGFVDLTWVQQLITDQVRARPSGEKCRSDGKNEAKKSIGQPAMPAAQRDGWVFQ